jgi:hypothetical protein
MLSKNYLMLRSARRARLEARPVLLQRSKLPDILFSRHDEKPASTYASLGDETLASGREEAGGVPSQGVNVGVGKRQSRRGHVAVDIAAGTSFEFQELLFQKIRTRQRAGAPLRPSAGR